MVRKSHHSGWAEGMNWGAGHPHTSIIMSDIRVYHVGGSKNNHWRVVWDEGRECHFVHNVVFNTQVLTVNEKSYPDFPAHHLRCEGEVGFMEFDGLIDAVITPGEKHAA